MSHAAPSAGPRPGPIEIIALTGDSRVPENSVILANIMGSAWQSAFRGILSDAVIAQYTQIEPCADMFSRILTSGVGAMYLAQQDSRPMGLLYWLPEAQKDARIEALLTIPDAWGQGVGPALMGKALADMKALGFTSVHVWPFAENHRARRFYQKYGFAPTGNSRQGDALELEYIRNF